MELGLLEILYPDFRKSSPLSWTPHQSLGCLTQVLSASSGVFMHLRSAPDSDTGVVYWRCYLVSWCCIVMIHTVIGRQCHTGGVGVHRIPQLACDGGSSGLWISRKKGRSAVFTSGVYSGSKQKHPCHLDKELYRHWLEIWQNIIHGKIWDIAKYDTIWLLYTLTVQDLKILDY